MPHPALAPNLKNDMCNWWTGFLNRVIERWLMDYPCVFSSKVHGHSSWPPVLFSPSCSISNNLKFPHHRIVKVNINGNQEGRAKSRGFYVQAHNFLHKMLFCFHWPLSSHLMWCVSETGCFAICESSELKSSHRPYLCGRFWRPPLSIAQWNAFRCDSCIARHPSFEPT